MRTQKLLAALLSSAMVLGTMAVPVLADGTVTTETGLTSAIASVAENGTVTLGSDIELNSTVEINNDVTINLNGHNITATDARALWVKSGNVTITGNGKVCADKSEDGKFDKSSSVIRVGDNKTNTSKAKLTIDIDVTVTSNHCYGVTVFGLNDTDNNKATSDIEFVLNNHGSVNVSGDMPAISGNGIGELSATTMTINGGVYGSANNATYAIYHPGKGTLTVNENATIRGNNGGIEAKAGKVIINGGKIDAGKRQISHTPSSNGTSTSGYAIAAVNNSSYAGEPAITVKDGDITGEVAIIDDDKDATNNTAKISITGGTFTSDPSAYVAAGYEATQSDNVWTVAAVAEGSYVAQIGDQKYTTLEDAVAAANAATSAPTIKLLADCDTKDATIKSPLTLTKENTTLDLNDKTITVNNNFSFVVQGDSTVVKNGKLVSGTNAAKKTKINSYILIVNNCDDVELSGLTMTGGISIGGSQSDWGTVTSPNITGVSGAGAATNVTISNCNVTSGDFYAVCSQMNSSATITSGTYTANTATTDSRVLHGFFKGTDGPEGLIKVEGGTFNGKINETNVGWITITGGTFTSDPQAYVAKGYASVPSGSKYVVNVAPENNTSMLVKATADKPVTIKSAVTKDVYKQVTGTVFTGGDLTSKTFKVTTTGGTDSDDNFTKTVNLTGITGGTHVSGNSDILCGLIIEEIPKGITVTVTVQ